VSVVEAHSSQDMLNLGAELGRRLEAGDVVVLHGPLGAGKTTLVRGLGAALGVEGMIQSPTFVVARVHRRTDSTQPPLVHVDAYRLTHHDEILDLDLDIDHSITVMEWGRTYAEHLVDEWPNRFGVRAAVLHHSAGETIAVLSEHPDNGSDG